MIKKYSDLIILFILWTISIISIVIAIVNSYEIGIQNYIGYGLLITVSILKYKKVKKIKTILGVLLVFGTVNAFQFTYSTMTFIFSWTPFGERYSTFGIQPLSILLLIFLVIANFYDFLGLLKEVFSEDPKVEDERQMRKTLKNYEELKNEKDSKLQEIVENKNMYQPEYYKAAQRLIEERKKQ